MSVIKEAVGSAERDLPYPVQMELNFVIAFYSR